MIKTLGVVTGVIILLATADANAQSCSSFPYTLTNGTAADANLVMYNFEYLANCAAPLASPSFTGDVGIGAAPATSLDVNGLIRAQGSNWPTTGLGLELAYDTPTGSGYIQSYNRNAGAWEPLYLGASAFTFATGQVKIGNLPGGTSQTLCVNANVISTCTSSRRYKENIKDASFGLDDVVRMRPVTFKWKGRNENDFGLIAEEVAKINPIFATYKDDQVEGVKYMQLTAVLINAIKQLKNNNDQLRSNLNQRSAMITHQEAELTELRANNELLDARLDQVGRRLDTLAPKSAMLFGHEHALNGRHNSLRQSATDSFGPGRF